MKVHALKNPNGDIIATFEKGSDGSLHMEPEVPQGHKIEVIEVSDDYKSDLNAFYKMKKSS
jgi:hypothetical protein